MSKINATNSAAKFEGGVFLIVPIVQLGLKISDQIWTVAVNTCKSLSAFKATNDAPNRDFIEELGDFIRYIKSDIEKNAADKYIYKDLLEALDYIKKIFDSDVSSIIFDKENDVLSVMSEASGKNNMLALNFAGYADDDDVDANFSDDKNNISLFAKNTGIKMSCKNRAGCTTWISTEHLDKITENIKKLYVKNGCTPNNSPAGGREYYFYSYLLQASIHAIAMNNRNQSPSVRKKIIDNFYKLANGILNGDFSLFENKKIKSDRPEDINKNFVNAMMDIILDGVEINNKQKDQWAETAITLATNISLADHATQLLVCDFDLNGRMIQRDGFIGKNNFFYLPMSKILEKIIRHYGVNSEKARPIKKVLEYIKNHEPNLLNMRNKIDFSELTDEKENKFGNNGRKIKNYDTDIKPSDFVEHERVPDDILKNSSSSELAKYLLAGANLNPEAFTLVDKNIIKKIIENGEEDMKLASEVLFSDYFEFIPRDLWYLVPNSCFKILLEPENKLKTMTPEQQFNLLNIIDRSDVIGENLKYIETDAFIKLQNENKINFSKIVSKLSDTLDKDSINDFIDLSKLENYAVEDILLARFYDLIDNKFNQINYDLIDNSYAKKILEEKFYCLTQESINKIKADAYKDLDINIWIKILNLAFEKNINLPTEVIKLINLFELKNKNLELYDKFIKKNIEILSDEQFLSLNIKAFDLQDQKDFYNKLLDQIKKRNMENNKLAQEIFYISYISASEIELNKIKNLDVNTLKYIFERYEFYYGFVDGLFEKINGDNFNLLIKSFGGSEKKLINMLDTKNLSGIVLNKLVEFFLNDMDESQICQIGDLNALEQKNFEKLLKNRFDDLNPDQFKSFFENKPDYKKLIFMIRYAKELKSEWDKVLKTQDFSKANEAENNYYQVKFDTEKLIRQNNSDLVGLDIKEEDIIKYPEYLAAKEKYYEEYNKLKSTRLEKKYNNYVSVIKNYVGLLDMKSIKDEHGYVEKPYYNITDEFKEFCDYNKDNFSEQQIIDLGADLYDKDGFTCDFVLHNLEVLYDKIDLNDLLIKPKTDYLKLIKRDLSKFSSASDELEREEYAKKINKILSSLPKRVLDNLYLSSFPDRDKQGFSELYNCLWLFSNVNNETDFELTCKKIRIAMDHSIGKLLEDDVKKKMVNNKMINLILDILAREANKSTLIERYAFDYFVYLVLGKTKDDKFLEDDLDKILDKEPVISIYGLNNLLERLGLEKQESKNIILKKDVVLKLINCLKQNERTDLHAPYLAVMNLLDFIEDSSLSDKEINNLIKQIEKVDLTRTERLSFKDKLLNKIEKISEPETLSSMFSFLKELDDESVNEILDKTDENFKIGAEDLKKLKDLASNNLRLVTLNKILKKVDFLNVSVNRIKNFIRRSLIQAEIYTRKEIEETLKIINDNHMEFRFDDGDNSGSIEQYQIVYYLFSRLKPEEQDLNYKNRLQKKMCLRFFTDYFYRNQTLDQNQNSIEDKFKFVIEKFLELARSYHDQANPHWCSGVGRYDKGKSLYKADSSINYLFLYGLENINLNGIDKKAKNKIFIEGISNYSDSKDRIGSNDIYFLVSCLEILTKSDYKIDEATLKKLCGGLFVDCATKYDFKSKAFATFTASCIKRLKKLYDGEGKDFDNVILDFIREAKKENAFGERGEVIDRLHFRTDQVVEEHVPVDVDIIYYNSYTYDCYDTYVLTNDYEKLERYCDECGRMYKDISNVELTEQEMSEVVKNENELKRQLDEKKKSDEYRKKLAVLSKVIKGEEMSDLVIYLSDDKINYLREKYKDVLDDMLGELDLIATGINIEANANQAKKIIEEKYGTYNHENAKKWLKSCISSSGVSLSATAGLVLSILFACNPLLILALGITAPAALGVSVVSYIKNKNNNLMVNKFIDELFNNNSEPASKNKNSKFKDAKAKLKEINEINKALDNIKKDLRE